MSFGARFNTTYGPIINFNCPLCGGSPAEGQTGDVTETTYITFIPVWRSKSTLVKCLTCKGILRSCVALPDLSALTPDQLNTVLRVRLDLVRASLAIFAFLLSPLPFAAVFMVPVAWFFNRKSPKWVRILVLASLASSVIWGWLWFYRGVLR